MKYEFPFAEPEVPPQLCHANFEGNFVVVFRPFFFGPSTKIPFIDGKVNRNREEWEVDDQIVRGLVTSICCDRLTGERMGLNVDLGCRGFVPLSSIPLQHQANLDKLVGETRSFEMHEVGKEHSFIVLRMVDERDG
ncbi:hypothetical protein [Aeoliella sp. SH292]|uniref:hypothetical protein n=1 Tax=Aeoliella sp. SH292 TaxID=3454464 RepID=UPI003F9DD458